MAAMFEQIPQAPPDPILGLTEAFQADSHPNKINLSVGVYKDEHGSTPILRCVREAERRLLENETTKSYLGIDGFPEFQQHVKCLLFGAEHEIVHPFARGNGPDTGGNCRLARCRGFYQTAVPHSTHLDE